jgi:hypothetical protein
MEAPINRLPAAQQQQQQHSSGGMAASGVISMDISSSTVHSRSHTASCSVLERFAALLGSKGRPQQDIGASSSRIKELTSLLSSTVDDDDVVLTVPSLDLRLTESGEKGPNELLPEVGAHAASATGTGASASDMKDGFSNGDSTAAGFASSSSSSSLNSSRPHMAASVLSMAPSLTSSSSSESTVADDQAVIDEAAQNIGKRTSWTRSTVGYASGAVGVNISDSFTTLLNSRLRAWTLLLLRHSLSTGSGESRTRLLSMLAADIQVKSIETDFKTLPLPDAAKGAKPKDSDIILPLLFQVTLHTTIQNQPENVTLRAPGTISGMSLCKVERVLFLEWMSRYCATWDKFRKCRL